MGSREGPQQITDELLARVTKGLLEIESRGTGECTMLAVEWTGSSSLPGICSQDKLAMESSKITYGHTKGHWGRYFSPAKTFHSEIIQHKIYLPTVAKLVLLYLVI